MIETGVADRFLEVRQRIAGAARRVQRNPEEVALVAITKGCSGAAVEAACPAGIRQIWQNRVQEQLESNASASDRSGAAPAVVREIFTASAQWPHIRICGLMGIAPLARVPEAARPYFCAVKALFDKAKQEERFARSMQWLSLGMSHDFEVAIEEGANMVRIGTAIFGPLS
ncbi:MAG: alanine racemase [Elusimicrobia bacterium]|nr:alanine racemase [Elusimicrobiota bacterium]